MARRRSNVIVRGPRRMTDWSLGPNTNGVQAVDETTTKLAWGATAVVTAVSTLVRTRGSWTAVFNTAASVNDGCTLGVGLIIVTAEAASVGVTAIPGPLTNMDDDRWLWHQIVPFLAPQTTFGGSTVPAQMYNFEIDSKAMRKLTDNDVIFGAIQTFDETGTYNVRFAADTRCLLKLP